MNQEQQQLVPGALVIATYRLPPVNQPWVQPFHVGTVEEPDPAPTWNNGRNSEADYCRSISAAKVRYEFGVQYEWRLHLIVITPEQAALSHREKVRVFLGEEALAALDRACPGYSK